MKRIFVILFILLTLCSCKNNNDVIDNSDTNITDQTGNEIILNPNAEWAETKYTLSEMLDQREIIDDYMILVPSWTKTSIDNINIYESDNGLLGLVIGNDINYSELVQKVLKTNNKIIKLTSNEETTKNFNGFKCNINIGISIFEDEKSNTFYSYEFSNDDINGYLIGITYNEDNKNEFNDMLVSMINSLNKSILE